MRHTHNLTMDTVEKEMTYPALIPDPNGHGHPQKLVKVNQKSMVRISGNVTNPTDGDYIQDSGSVSSRNPHHESTQQPFKNHHNRPKSVRLINKQGPCVQSRADKCQKEDMKKQSTHSTLLNTQKYIGPDKSHGTDTAFQESQSKHRQRIKSKGKEMRLKHCDLNTDDSDHIENYYNHGIACAKYEQGPALSRSAEDNNSWSNSSSLNGKNMSSVSQHLSQENISVFDVKIKTGKETIKKITPQKKKGKNATIESGLMNNAHDGNTECKYCGSNENLVHNECNKNMLQNNEFHPVTAMPNRYKIDFPPQQSEANNLEVERFLRKVDKNASCAKGIPNRIEQTALCNKTLGHRKGPSFQGNNNGKKIIKTVIKTCDQNKDDRLNTTGKNADFRNGKKFDSLLQRLPSSFSQSHIKEKNRRLSEHTSIQMKMNTKNNNKNFDNIYAELDDVNLEDVINKNVFSTNFQTIRDKNSKLGTTSQDFVEELPKSNKNQSRPQRKTCNEMENDNERPKVCPRLAWGSPEIDRKAGNDDKIKLKTVNVKKVPMEDVSDRMCLAPVRNAFVNKDTNISPEQRNNDALDNEENEQKPIVTGNVNDDVLNKEKSKIIQMGPCMGEGTDDMPANDKQYSGVLSGEKSGQIMDVMHDFTCKTQATVTKAKNKDYTSQDKHQYAESLRGKMQTTLDKMKSSLWAQTQNGSSKKNKSKMFKVFSWKPLKSKWQKHHKPEEGDLEKQMEDLKYESYFRSLKKQWSCEQKGLEPKSYIKDFLQNHPNMPTTNTEFKVPQNLTEMFAASNPGASASPTPRHRVDLTSKNKNNK